MVPFFFLATANRNVSNPLIEIKKSIGNRKVSKRCQCTSFDYLPKSFINWSDWHNKNSIRRRFEFLPPINCIEELNIQLRLHFSWSTILWFHLIFIQWKRTNHCRREWAIMTKWRIVFDACGVSHIEFRYASARLLLLNICCQCQKRICERFCRGCQPKP